MKVHMKYPILLTLIEHKYLKHHFEDERTSADVYKALYLQGEQLKDDRVVHWRPLAARPNRDERGVGWKDANSCWLTQDEHTFQVTAGQDPVPVELPRGLTSASGRFVWTVEQSAEEATLLQQLDRQSGETSTIWEHPGWAGLSLASDPAQDRLLWSYSGYHLSGPLHSWNPIAAQKEAVPTGFAEGVSDLAFSPNGKNLAFVHDHQVYCLSNGATRPISGPRSNSFNYRQQPSWSPDSKRLFYVNAHYDIVGYLMQESYQWMAALPDGSQHRALISRSAVAAVNVGPALD
ncbi:MAG: PD40 domain-containing protein [Candidatus Eremiobacteraeota bacterium]|nr:PD40 domain-containing protein [Candidatus Eremiobacteraeota bacterium]MCW5867555.1 PD40 domain-containing protein [Candidatus Eremiobacteraeota bacterium]